MSGDTTGPSQTTKAINPQQSELVKLGLPFAKQFAANPPTYPSNTVAPFNPNQVTGQNLALGATTPQTQLASTGADLAKFLSGDVLRPETNPALSQYIQTATQPIYDTLLTQTLPAIRGQAATTGNFGSSRQGIAEGLASRGASQAAGNVAANIANAGYTSGLDALLKGYSLLPQTTNLQLAPALTTSGVGDVQQQQAQNELTAQTTAGLYNQLFPLISAQGLLGLAGAVPTQEVQTSATVPQPNEGLQAAGLGIQAATTLLPLLLSDRRLKRHIKQVGRLPSGVPVFEFEYKAGGARTRGFMSDSVPRSAVVEILGFEAVDYRKVLEAQ